MKSMMMICLLVGYSSLAGLQEVPQKTDLSSLSNCIEGLEDMLKMKNKIEFQNGIPSEDNLMLINVPLGGYDMSKSEGAGVYGFGEGRYSLMEAPVILTSKGVLRISDSKCSLNADKKDTGMNAFMYLNKMVSDRVPKSKPSKETISLLSACDNVVTKNPHFLEIKEKVKGFIAKRPDTPNKKASSAR